MPVVRGCGTRVLGGVYIETLLSPDGHPIECFIKDPAVPVDPNALGLTPVGIKLLEHQGVTHIFDWVGEGYYPNVSDFIEEVRRFGASRRMPSTMDFSKLTPASQLVLVHSKAFLWQSQGSTSPQLCPRVIRIVHDHVRTDTMNHLCSSQWWVDHDAKSRLLPGEEYQREMPSFTYTARQQMGPYTEPPKPGIFMILPISRVSVVRDPSTNSHENTERKIREKLSSDIPLDLVDE